MSAPLYLYDCPADLAVFLPFSLSRPLGELRYGAFLLRERWADLAGRPVSGYLAAPHLSWFTEAGSPPVLPAPGDASAPRLLFRSTFLPQAGATFPAEPTAPARYVDGTGDTVGVALPRGQAWAGLSSAAAWPSTVLAGRHLEGVWQLIGDLPTVLPHDLERLRGAAGGAHVPRGCTVLGDPALLLAAEALVEPHVVFDVRQGPVWLGPGVEVRSFTRLSGPLAVHQGTRVVGGQIRESAIGPRCVVQGELSNTVFLGYANKAHEGFVGHSVIGRWANLGAGTVTSNLKNTYGPVRLSLAGERRETGLMFLGSLIGDHVKTAIGTMLPTGCVVGTGAHLFGSRPPGPEVPPFAWGTDAEGRVLECRRFIEMAERVMPRRGVAVDDATRRYLADLYEAATGRTACA